MTSLTETAGSPGNAPIERPADEAAPRWPRGGRGIRYGGDYNPEQWPRAVWREDVALMREAGIDLVSVGIFSWALLEPEAGRYDFAWLDEVLGLLAEAGIDVDLGTPTAAPPAWFWKAHPEAHPVTRDGVRLGSGSRGSASPSSAAYRAACAGIVERLAERYAKHPAVVMWHVHNEYGVPVGESYDDESVAAFRRWLELRYRTIDGLNAAWGTTFWGQRYGAWDEIDAPRTAASVVNPAQRLDFARFTSDALLECFVLERDVIKRHAPHLPVTTNFMATNHLGVDYWRWAREVDVVANDHYLVAERADSHVQLALDADLTRSLAAGRPWMLMEHSTSAVNWQPRNLAKRPGELARNSMVHVARGADAVLFFQFRASRFGAEKFHSAMLPHSGTGSRIWQEVVELGGRLAALAPLRGSTVHARVAIVWDWQSFWAQDLEWRPSVDLEHRERIEAFYAALWRRGVTVDFVHPEAPLEGYDVLLAPASYLLTRTAGDNLTAFVGRGGRLVVSFFSGVVDEHDTVHPGGFPGPLSRVLGLTVEEVLPFGHGERAEVDGGGTAGLWAEQIRPATAEVLARFRSGRADGLPAVTRNVLGEGAAWYVGTALDEDGLDRLLVGVLREAGIQPGDRTTRLEVVERTSASGTFVVAVNHGDDDAVLAARPGDRDLWTGVRTGGTVAVPAGEVRVLARYSGPLHDSVEIS